MGSKFAAGPPELNSDDGEAGAAPFRFRRPFHLLLGGLLFTLFALHRISLRLHDDRGVAFASFLPMAGLGVVLTLVSLWMLGAPLPYEPDGRAG